jgi:hypothetical protein
MQNGALLDTFFNLKMKLMNFVSTKIAISTSYSNPKMKSFLLFENESQTFLKMRRNA